MNRIFTLLILLFTGLGAGMAQDKESGNKEKMFREVREFKIKYLAQEMELSESQTPKFIDLYDEMSASRDSCYRHVRKMEKNLKKSKDATEEEYQKVTEAMNEANVSYAEIEKVYDEKFAEFLSPKQIYMMKEAEQKFRSKLEGMRQDRKKREIRTKR